MKHEKHADRRGSCKTLDVKGQPGRGTFRFARLDDILIREGRRPSRPPGLCSSLRKERTIVAVIAIPFCLNSFFMNGAFTGIICTLVFGGLVWLIRFNPFIPERIKNVKLRVMILMIGLMVTAITLFASLFRRWHP